MTAETNALVTVDPRIERLVRDLTRWRLVFLLLAVVAPAGCYGLFERQARRLDALGDHGVPTAATVTRTNQHEAAVDYAYEVGGTTYTWNVAQKDAPYAVGESFAVTYLPEDPSLSRPGERTRAAAEAASNRAFAWKVEVGVFLFFALNFVLCDVRLRRLRKTGQTELTDPAAYRTRLVLSAAMLLPLLVLICWWHASDALHRGEPVWPVVAGLGIVLAIIGAVGYFAARDGPAAASARSSRILRWVAPLAAGIAALRAVAWLAGWR